MTNEPRADGLREQTFDLPDLGEGLTEAEIVRWLVDDGAVVTVNQPLIEVETAKAAVEIPSPLAGTVYRRHGSEGAVVPVGAALVTFLVPDTAGDAAPTSVTDRELSSQTSSGPVLVGYGVSADATKRRARVRAPSPHGTDRHEAGPPGEAVKPVRHGGLEIGRAAEARFADSVDVVASPFRAKPPVRKLARDLGVALADVRPSGPNGTVTREDVAATAALLSPGGTAAGSAPSVMARTDGEREPVRGVARAMAQAMTRSALSIPQVTVWVEVDVSQSSKLLERLRRSPTMSEHSATPSLLVARACLAAIRRQPLLNSTYDAATEEIVHRSQVNLGIAAATTRGLLVPNIKGAQSLTFVELADALAQLTAKARDGVSTPSDLTGGTFTITNVGVFGVDGGTPLINPGESAILAIGTWRQKPWVVDGNVVPRTVATLSVTFDHRIIDGATGSKFLRDVADLLEEPAADLAW